MQGAQKHRPLARGDACQACKRRKVRCSADIPSCSNCLKKGKHCVYLRQQQVPDIPDSSSFNHDYSTTSTSSGPSTSIATDLNGFSEMAGGGLTLDQNLPLADPCHHPPSVAHRAFNGYGPELFDWSQFPVGSFVPSISYGSGLDDYGGQTLPTDFDNIDFSWLLEADPSPASQSAEPTAEITIEERDHLLWLYFTNQRIFGLEMHVATFYESLHSPDPSQHPHPCLLNAMYLVTCGASPSATIRARETAFFQAAFEAKDLAIGKDERLFDAMRATTLLSTWLYNVGRFPEATVMVSIAVRIAVSCGLDIISSSRFTPCKQQPLHLRHMHTYLPDPASQIHLAERIYAFWAIFLIDRCAAVSQDWPAGFDLDRVFTPLPLPWSEYEKADDTLGTKDETLHDLIYGGRDGAVQTTDLGQILKAVTLVHRASLLDQVLPKSTSPNYDAVCSDGQQARTERARLERALENFVQSLPLDLKSVNYEAGESRITSRTATLQFIIGAAEIYLYDTNSMAEENTRTLVVVRRLLGIMRLLGDEDTGDVSLFVVMIWSIIGYRLIREYHRLDQLGDSIATALVAADISSVISSLQVQGKRLRLAAIQAHNLTKWRHWDRNEVTGNQVETH